MTEIKVRNATEQDIPAVAEIYRGINAAADTLQNPYISNEFWISRIKAVPEGVYSLVAEIENEVVGQLGFSAMQHARRKHVGTLGMAVKDGHHRQGVGAALMTAVVDLADNWLAVRRLELTVFTDNKAAIALYEKFGFVIEGEAKEFAFRAGQYVDAYYMARHVDQN